MKLNNLPIKSKYQCWGGLLFFFFLCCFPCSVFNRKLTTVQGVFCELMAGLSEWLWLCFSPSPQNVPRASLLLLKCAPLYIFMDLSEVVILFQGKGNRSYLVWRESLHNKKNKNKKTVEKSYIAIPVTPAVWVSLFFHHHTNNT